MIDDIPNVREAIHRIIADAEHVTAARLTALLANTELTIGRRTTAASV